jgi:DNA polymerase-3 subunit alpha
MSFGTYLDENGDWIDSIHFPDVHAKYPYRGVGVYALYGKIVEDFGTYSIELVRQRKINNLKRFAEIIH